MDRAVETSVARLVDLAHAAGAKGGLDLVRAEAPADVERHAVELRGLYTVRFGHLRRYGLIVPLINN